MSALKLYTTLKAIDTATVAFTTQGLSLQAEAHKLAMSVLVHFGKNHDIRVVANFVKAMPEMARVNALKDWFCEFGPISFGEDGKTVTFVKDKATRVGDADAKPFWKFSPEPKYEAIDVVKMLASLQKKIETDTKKTGRNHTAVLNALKAIKVTEHVAVATKVAKPKALKKAIAARKAIEATTAPVLVN
jgi:hypothetical protein